MNKLKIKIRSFYILYIKNQRAKKSVDYFNKCHFDAVCSGIKGMQRSMQNRKNEDGPTVQSIICN